MRVPVNLTPIGRGQTQQPPCTVCATAIKLQPRDSHMRGTWHSCSKLRAARRACTKHTQHADALYTLHAHHAGALYTALQNRCPDERWHAPTTHSQMHASKSSVPANHTTQHPAPRSAHIQRPLTTLKQLQLTTSRAGALASLATQNTHLRCLLLSRMQCCR